MAELTPEQYENVFHELGKLKLSNHELDNIRKSPTMLRQLADLYDNGGTIELDKTINTTRYEWPKTGQKFGKITIGSPEGFSDSDNPFLTANTIAHELGHAFGLHRNEAIAASDDNHTESLNEYLDAFAHTEGDAGLAQYQAYLENKNDDFEKQHADILREAKRIVDKNPYGEAIFDEKYDTPEGIAIRKAMAEELGEFMRKAAPSSQAGKGESALTYDEEGALSFVKNRTTLTDIIKNKFFPSNANNHDVLEAFLGDKDTKDFAQSIKQRGNEVTFNVTHHDTQNGMHYNISMKNNEGGNPNISITEHDENHIKVREINSSFTTSNDGKSSIYNVIDTIFNESGKVDSVKTSLTTVIRDGNGIEQKRTTRETDSSTGEVTITESERGGKKTVTTFNSNEDKEITTVVTTDIVKNGNSYTQSTVTSTHTVNKKTGLQIFEVTPKGKDSVYKHIINPKTGVETIQSYDEETGKKIDIRKQYPKKSDGSYDFNGEYDWIASESSPGENKFPPSRAGHFDPKDPTKPGSEAPPDIKPPHNDPLNSGNNGNANENGNNGNTNENGSNGNANENGNNGNPNENGSNDNGNNPANPSGLPICTILGAFAGGIVGNKFGGPLGAIIGAGVGAQHGANACGEPDPWKPPFPPLRLDPLSLDLNGDGKIGTLPLARGVHFDMDNSGFAEKLSWIAPEDGLLVNLADGATRVSNGSQLLGNETRLPSGELAADGFEALAALDDNGDGKVDAQDAAFAHLRVWQDKNSDGIASADELFTLESLGIFSLATAYDASTWTDANGVEHRGEGAFAMKDAGGLMQTLWFTADKVDSVAVDVHHGSSAGLPEAVTRLPNAAGFGNVDTLHRAMNADADLRALVETFVTEADPAARQTLTEQILRRWAKADAVTGTRGALDARDLAVLEAFWGQPALAEQPTGAYARSVAQVYEDLKSLLHAQLSLQSHYREWYGLVQFRVQHGAWEINDTALADAIAQRFGAGSVNAATVGDFLDAVQGLTPGNAALLQHLTVSVRQASAQLPQESRSALHEVIHRGDDRIVLTDGEDFVNAGAGNDRIEGNAGSNVIMDGAGNDAVHAGAGDDVLVSGSGNDSLDGGSGNDVYRFDRHSGHDTVHNVDNDPGRHDEIHLTGHDMTEVDISRVNNDLVIRGHDGESSVTVRDHFNGAPIDAVRFSDDIVFDRAFLDKVARANSDPDYPDPTDWVENGGGQYDLDALLNRLANGSTDAESRDKQPDWRKLLDRLSHGTDSPRDIDEVDSLIAQLENGTTGKRDAAQLHYDHPHGTGGAHDPLDRLIDTWAGI
jgi:iron-regulated protein frpA